MGQDISLTNIADLDLEILKQYEGHIIDILPDENNPKWKVNIIISQDYMKPYFRLRTRKGEPVVKIRNVSSPMLLDFSDFSDFCLTGETENFPRPSSQDELKAFDDEVFISGTRSVQVSLNNRGRTRSIPDLATLRKKAKAPCKPKFFDKLLNNVGLAKKNKSSGQLCSPSNYEENSNEDSEANYIVDECVDVHRSLEEITSIEVDGSLLQQLEEKIKSKGLFSQSSEENTAKQECVKTCDESNVVKRLSLEEDISSFNKSEETENNLVKRLSLEGDNSNFDKSEETESNLGKRLSLEEHNSNFEKSDKTEEHTDTQSETDNTIKTENKSENIDLKINVKSSSVESPTVSASTPNSPKASPGIVQERLARFRQLAERRNRDPRLRRSSSVPSSPDTNKKDLGKESEHIDMFNKVHEKFKPISKMSEEEQAQYGGVAVKPGYVKALVSQINKNKGPKDKEICASPPSEPLLNNNGNQDADLKIVNGQSEKDVSSQTAINNDHLDSPVSSNRNSLKSSECGGISDTTSSGQDKTENESGIVSDGISSMNPAELFDSSWSESDIDSLHLTDSEEDTCKAHEPCSKKNSTDSKGFTESTETPKDRIQKIVEELLSTERAYVTRLKLLDQTFQFRVVQENKIHNFLPDGVIPQMFSNVQSIYQFHNDFLLPQIAKRVENWSPESKIGDMMKQYAPLLKMYTEYVKNFDNAMNMISVWSEKSPKFAAIIKEIQMTPECGSLTLQHHMLEPVQRIPRYEMLLKDYLKRLPEDAADREDAKVALELVTKAACHSNEAMKKIDSFNKLLEIVRKIDTNENLISPTRELIREGRITKISARGGERLERFLFLFNDLMLICFEPLLGSYKIKSQLSMDGIEIMERSDKCLRWILEGESIDIPNTFYVKSTQKIIQFLDENANGEPSGWCEIIKATIANYKRRKLQKGNSIKEAGRNSGMTDVELGKVAPKWIKDDEVTMCMKCTVKFTAIRRRHHCRACGDVVCGRCSSKKVPLHYDDNHLNRVCDDCYLLLRNEEEELPHKKEKEKRKKDILQVNASDPSVLSGYLHVSTDKGKSWHKRWVAIHNNFVMYTFKAHQDPYAMSSLPLPGHVVEDMDKSEHIERENVFKLSHKRLTIMLSSENTASKDRWMYVLGKIVLAELPDNEISHRDSSHSSSSNESTENIVHENSHL